MGLTIFADCSCQGAAASKKRFIEREFSQSAVLRYTDSSVANRSLLLEYADIPSGRYVYLVNDETGDWVDLTKMPSYKFVRYDGVDYKKAIEKVIGAQQ